MEETYNINNIDALLEELKEIAGELNEQILSNCPHKDINCIIGQLKGFYYNLNDNNLNDNNLLTTINKHISPKRHIKTLQNLLKTKIGYHFTFLIKSS